METIDWIKEEKRLVRRSADIIALVELGSILINYLLYPLVHRLPAFAAGGFGAELRDLILYLIIFAVPVAVASKLSGITAGELMGEDPPASVYLMTIGLTMGWSLLANYLGVSIEGILNIFGLTETVDAYVLPSSGAALAVQIISVAVVPPIVEELCYRGFFLHTAVRSMGTWGAIVLTSAAFWLAHYSIEILPLAFGFGVIGGYIRQRYGSLLPSMCGHLAVNSVYLIVNICWEKCGSQTGAAVSAVVYLIEIFMGAIGIALFVRNGCLKELVDGKFGQRSLLTPWQLASAVLTSVPVWVILIMAVYFTAGGLGVL
ncbi:MAG: type II CAAX endopeptidase family protein [Eubacteriales bacterium]|nr:type II CAAX endopeptidase family protein [Eubacteriales bacterium]